METDNGRTKSLWMATAETPGDGRLAEDIKADVCIVGTGVAGLSIGYHLSREGKKVVLLDDGPTAGGGYGQQRETYASLQASLLPYICCTNRFLFFGPQ